MAGNKNLVDIKQNFGIITSMSDTYDPTGFVCPDWAQGNWSSRESTVEKCTDGNYAVVCHQTQATIYKGTRRDCELFLKIEG